MSEAHENIPGRITADQIVQPVRSWDGVVKRGHVLCLVDLEDN